jgi:hypothetical protein
MPPSPSQRRPPHISILGFSLNIGSLSVQNFANKPGLVNYSFDAGNGSQRRSGRFCGVHGYSGIV